MAASNENFILMKCLHFCFYGGISCLFAFLPSHLLRVGLTPAQGHIISIVAPLLGVIGPLLVGPFADRLERPNTRSLRTMLAVCLVASALGCCTLLAIPTLSPALGAGQADSLPAVSFSCSQIGASIVQDRCFDSSPCQKLPTNKVGSLRLSDCRYDCKSDANELLEHKGEEDHTEYYDEPREVESELDAPEEENSTVKNERKKRHAISHDEDPPHLCIRDHNGKVECHVYTETSQPIMVNVTIGLPIDPGSYQHWCRYPIGNDVWCRIPEALLAPMGHDACNVVCALEDPYDMGGSVLADTRCLGGSSDPGVVFWSYLLVRSVAEIFPLAVITLLNAAIVLSSRETSSEIGRHLAFGSLGCTVFPPLVGLFMHTNILSMPKHPFYLLAFAVYAILMIISAMLVMFNKSIPQFAFRSARTVSECNGLELSALLCILIILGALFAGLDGYLPWHLSDLGGTSYFTGLTLAIGALPAILLLWYSSQISTYCGHTNILIAAFAVYILRYIGLFAGTHLYWTIPASALQMFTLGLPWASSILYIRHLVPIQLTATSQGAAVIAHFCIGRSLGAIVVAVASEWGISLTYVYYAGAISSAMIGSIYFTVYHCCLKPRLASRWKSSAGIESPFLQVIGVLLCICVIAAIIYSIL